MDDLRQFFFTNNTDDKRGLSFVNALYKDDIFQFREITEKTHPALWQMITPDGHKIKSGKDVHDDFVTFIKDVAIYHTQTFKDDNLKEPDYEFDMLDIEQHAKKYKKPLPTPLPKPLPTPLPTPLPLVASPVLVPVVPTPLPPVSTVAQPIISTPKSVDSINFAEDEIEDVGSKINDKIRNKCFIWAVRQAILDKFNINLDVYVMKNVMNHVQDEEMVDTQNANHIYDIIALICFYLVNFDLSLVVVQCENPEEQGCFTHHSVQVFGTGKNYIGIILKGAHFQTIKETSNKKVIDIGMTFRRGFVLSVYHICSFNKNDNLMKLSQDYTIDIKKLAGSERDTQKEVDIEQTLIDNFMKTVKDDMDALLKDLKPLPQPNQSGGSLIDTSSHIYTNVLAIFNTLPKIVQVFYKTFIEVISESGLVFDINNLPLNLTGLYVSLKKQDGKPYFIQFIPNVANLRDIYMSNLVTPTTLSTNTSFNLEPIKLYKVPVFESSSIVRTKKGFERHSTDKKLIPFNDEVCEGTFFNGSKDECNNFTSVCLNNNDIGKCIDIVKNSNFDVANDMKFVNEMHPDTALNILENLGFKQIDAYDQILKCSRKKMESAISWRNRILPTLTNANQEKILKQLDMFIKYLTAIVEYINAYSFILNVDACPVKSRYYRPQFGGAPEQSLHAFIKFNRHERGNSIDSQKTIEVDSVDMMATYADLLGNVMKQLKKKPSSDDVEKINKFLKRIDEFTQGFVQKTSKLESLNQTHQIMRYTPSGGSSQRLIDESKSTCQKDSDKIKSSEKKLELVVSKLVN